MSRLTPSRIAWLIWLLNALLVGVLGYGTAAVLCGMLERSLAAQIPEVSTQQIEHRAAPRLRKQQPVEGFQSILTVNAFGAARRPPPESNAPTVAEETEPIKPGRAALELSLFGVYADTPDGFAVLAGPGNHPPTLYRVGECVPSKLEGGSRSTASASRPVPGRPGRGARSALSGGGRAFGGAALSGSFSSRSSGVRRPSPSAGASSFSGSIPRPRRRTRRGERPPCGLNQGRLIAVENTQAIVRYGGERLSFSLEETDTASAAPPPARAAAPARPSAPSRPDDEESRPSRSGRPFPYTRNGRQYEYRVPNEEVEAAFNNFASLLKQARVVPHLVDGEAVGFQIKRIRSGSIFQRLGLRSGDVITEVNGEDVTNAEQAIRLMSLFRNSREVNLSLERRKKQYQFSYVIE